MPKQKLIKKGGWQRIAAGQINSTQEVPNSAVTNLLLNKDFDNAPNKQELLNQARQENEAISARLAAALSVAGQIVQLIPGMAPLGVALSIPDLVSDSIAFTKEPSASNAGHITVDVAEPFYSRIRKIIRRTPTKLDDAVLWGFRSLGIIDDLFSTSGRDLFNYEENVQSKK